MIYFADCCADLYEYNIHTARNVQQETVATNVKKHVLQQTTALLKYLLIKFCY